VRRLMSTDLRSLAILTCLAAVLVALVSGDRVSARPPNDATYIGQKKCRTCHFGEFRAWRKMKHAGAWETLAEKDRGRPECLRCHVTGYGKPGGYASEKETAGLTGVQCEACHGPGSAHAEAAKVEEDEAKIDALIDKSPGARCVECHNPHKSHDEYEKEAGK
jgi:hypothetical protein